MKKIFCILLTIFCLIPSLSGCFTDSSEFDIDREINVISREDGSGTRGAFTDIFELVKKGDGGTKKDLSTKEAVIAKQTDVLMTSISSDRFAIGYISLGSLNDTVKPVKIDGVTASAENVKDGGYKVVRPFVIVTKENRSEIAGDFIDYILSSDGQTIVSESYISVSDNASAYSGNRPSGKIVIAGSSSVTPIMEKLKESYLKINPNAKIELQQSDSSAGITGTEDGTCDIGMSSRDLTESELDGLVSENIALDGIVIVVNNVNPIDSLSKDDVKKIYMGEITKWSEIGG